MYAGLHDEIWIRILEHLGRPVPRANSGAYKGDLMQPDWATCMLVSSTFNSYTSPLLYKRVITDRLDWLLQGTDRGPAHPHIASKRELLKRVKHLDIEYPDPYQDLPYHDILKGDRDSWDMIGLPLAFVAQNKYSMWLGGLIKQFKDIDRLARHHPDTWNIETLTYNAYLPVHDAEWDLALHSFGMHEDMQGQLLLCQDLAGKFVQTSGARHYCQRSNRGPLRCVRLQAYNQDHRPGRNGAPMLVMHQQRFETRIYGSATKIRWVFEIPARGTGKQIEPKIIDAMDGIAHIPALADHMDRTLRNAPVQQEIDKGKRLAAYPPAMELYISRPIPPLAEDATTADAPRRERLIEGQRRWLDRQDKALKRSMHGPVGHRLKISLGILDDAPVCAACGV